MIKIISNLLCFLLSEKFRQKIKKINYIVAVCLIPVIVDDNISLTDRLLYFQKPYGFIFDTSPGKFRPETNSQIGRNHILHCGWIIAFKNNPRRKSRMLAKTIADITEFPGAKKTDKSLFFHFRKTDGCPIPIFFIFRHSQINFFCTGKTIFFI